MPGWLGDTQKSFNAVIWSVSVEIFVYADFLAYTVSMKATILRSLIIAGMALAGAQMTGNLILSCAPFFVGCAADEATLALRTRSAGTHLGSALAILILPISVAILLRRIGRKDLWMLPLEYGVSAGTLMLCGVADVQIPPVPKALRWIDDMTESVYLLHMPVMIAMLIFAKKAGWSEASIQSGLVLLAFLSIVLILSRLAYAHLEKPAQIWLRARLVPDRREPAAGETAGVI